MVAAVRVGDPRPTGTLAALVRGSRPHWTYRVCVLASLQGTQESGNVHRGRDELVVVRRRYTDFAALHRVLGRTGVPPPLPPPALWPPSQALPVLAAVAPQGPSSAPPDASGAQSSPSATASPTMAHGEAHAQSAGDGGFYARRAAALERYLSRVLANPRMRTSAALCVFLADTPAGAAANALERIPATLGDLPETRQPRRVVRTDAVDEAFARAKSVLGDIAAQQQPAADLLARNNVLADRMAAARAALEALAYDAACPSAPRPLSHDGALREALAASHSLRRLLHTAQEAHAQLAEAQSALARRETLAAAHHAARTRALSCQSALATLATHAAAAESPADRTRVATHAQRATAALRRAEGDERALLAALETCSERVRSDLEHIAVHWRASADEQIRAVLDSVSALHAASPSVCTWPQ